jgi:hypothetical protein
MRDRRVEVEVLEILDGRPPRRGWRRRLGDDPGQGAVVVRRAERSASAGGIVVDATRSGCNLRASPR